MKAKEIKFDNFYIRLYTDDGRVGVLPLKSYPRLYNATHTQRENYTLGSFGVHWPDLDEDLSYEGFFTGQDAEAANEIAELFRRFPELNLDKTARVWEINPTLMSKYRNALKNPSGQRVETIKRLAGRLGRELMDWSEGK